jgi:hypothetical protein
MNTKIIVAAVAVAVLALGGCGTASTTRTTSTGPDGTVTTIVTGPHGTVTTIVGSTTTYATAPSGAGPQPAREAAVNGGSAHASGHCPAPSRVLVGVYSPDRLRVIDSCRRLVGTVTSVTPEEDGDMHVHVRPHAAYRSLLRSNDYYSDGTLVTELMPRDHGHLPAPRVGDRVSMTGAYVFDEDHYWPELHPIWTLSINGGRTYVSGPQFGGSPPTASSENAVHTCRTNSTGPCVGYGESAPNTSGGTGTTASDRVRVFASCDAVRAAGLAPLRKGTAEYRANEQLDGDHDGLACE